MPRKQPPPPVWNVYMEDFNGKCIKVFNVFNHWTFHESLKKELKKYKNEDQVAQLEEEVRMWARYCFWSKCEYEIILTSWPPRREDSGFKDKKIDIFDQLCLNWDSFFQYILEHKRNILYTPKKDT